METQKVVNIPQTKVEVKVAKDPEKRTGLRGLKGMVFGEFQKSWDKNQDFTKLPDRDTMTKLVLEKFPQSMWIAKPKIHYGYYKSKFMTMIKDMK